MTMSEVRGANPAKREKVMKAPRKRGQQRLPASRSPKAVEVAADTDAATVSKLDRLVSLRSRRDGTTIAEMVDATGWLTHSVRGFLAGTVKKKLGYELASTKRDGEARRYRIVTRRGR